MYLLGPFILQNLKKNIRADSELWGCVPFVLNNIFLVQTIIFTFIYLLALFIVQNLKKFLRWIQTYEDAPFLGLKWSICPKQICFEKLSIPFSSTY